MEFTRAMRILFAVAILLLVLGLVSCSSDVTKPAHHPTQDLLASETTIADWQVIQHWGTDSIPTLSVVSFGDAHQDKFVTLFSSRRYDLTQYDELVISYEIDVRASEQVDAGARIGYSLGTNDPVAPNLVYPFMPSSAVGHFGGGDVHYVCSEARTGTAGLTNVYLAVDLDINRVDGAGPDTSSVSIEHFTIVGVRH